MLKKGLFTIGILPVIPFWLLLAWWGIGNFLAMILVVGGGVGLLGGIFYICSSGRTEVRRIRLTRIFLLVGLCTSISMTIILIPNLFDPMATAPFVFSIPVWMSVGAGAYATIDVSGRLKRLAA